MTLALCSQIRLGTNLLDKSDPFFKFDHVKGREAASCTASSYSDKEKERDREIASAIVNKHLFKGYGFNVIICYSAKNIKRSNNHKGSNSSRISDLKSRAYLLLMLVYLPVFIFADSSK